MKETIFGFIALFAFASPFLALIFIIAFKVYRKFRPSQAKGQVERQTERTQGEPSMPTSSHSQRALAEFMATILLVALAGVLAGIIAAIFSQLIYMVLVFPLLMGFAGGRVITGGIQMAKIRKAPQMILLALVAAITIYGTYHYGRYIALQIETSFTMFPGFSEATADKHLSAAKALVDYALKKETGLSGFAGYMLFKAKEGVSIGRWYHSDRLNLGPVLTWGYWVLEFGMIFYVTFLTGKNLINRAFCEYCGNWYGRERHLGGTRMANKSALTGLIEQKDFIQIGRLLDEDAGLPSLELYWQGCEVCKKSRSQLVVRHAFQSQKGGLSFTDTSRTILQPQESVRLLHELKLVDSLP